MNKKTKLIIIVAAGILAIILIWRFFNQYLYKSKAAEKMVIQYVNDSSTDELDNINTPVNKDRIIKVKIQINGSLKISGFSLKLETDKDLNNNHFIKIKSVGAILPPASDTVGTSLGDSIYLNTWLYKSKDNNSLPSTIIIPVTITGLQNGCGNLAVTAGYAVGPNGYYPLSSYKKTGDIGTGSCAPVPTRTPVPLNVTPTLAVPQSSNPEATYDNVNNKINFSFQFQGNNTATASLIPQCYYSEIVPEIAPTWVSMTVVVTANLTPPPAGGRPYPGNTNGTLVCQSGLVTAGKAYKMIASTYAWYDTDGDKLYRSEAVDGVRKISATVETTLIAQVGGPTLTPTLTPTATPTVTPGGPTLTPTPTTSPRARGDANNDGSINEADFTIWRTTYGTQYSVANPKPAINADFNNDNWVNMTDFEIWRQSVKGL